jgi:hypothetical protein
MLDLSLLTMCIAAFISVFILLFLLAAIMRLMLIIFPQRQRDFEPALVAAITSAARAAYPGSAVTRIEEEK